ncbi:unnamed protein product [Symbiodinium necroappetens]|uniref:Uncharacterized protein n=1 Tax=Symbiodinium necroappetens TaxID=1628268 RepID=A0A812N3L7_9DINO|nr:unnamed protein product [Symbiodinium necroappetens]
MVEGTQVPTIGNYLLAAEAFFSERYDLVKEWKDKCENATNTPFANEELCKEKICLYYDKKIGCDETQEVFEKKSCDLHKSYTCGKYSDCYDQKKDIYSNVVALAKENEVAAKAEWRAVKRIECLINALRAPQSELDAAIEACKGKIYATTDVQLTYKGDAPAARSCTEALGDPRCYSADDVIFDRQKAAAKKKGDVCSWCFVLAQARAGAGRGPGGAENDNGARGRCTGLGKGQEGTGAESDNGARGRCPEKEGAGRGPGQKTDNGARERAGAESDNGARVHGKVQGGVQGGTGTESDNGARGRVYGRGREGTGAESDNGAWGGCTGARKGQGGDGAESDNGARV